MTHENEAGGHDRPPSEGGDEREVTPGAEDVRGCEGASTCPEGTGAGVCGDGVLAEALQNIQGTIPALDAPPVGVPPKLKDIAADWGTSIAYVSRVLPRASRGSLEEARAWRLEHASAGVGFRSRSKEGEGARDGGVARASRRPKKLRSIQASLEAAIEIEEQAKWMVDQAIEAKLDEKIGLRIAAYSKAQDGRMKAEKAVQEFMKEAKVLVPLDAAKALIKKAWGPHLARLRACARNAAPLANPEDDLLAEKVFRQEIEKAIAETSGKFEDKSATRPAEE